MKTLLFIMCFVTLSYAQNDDFKLPEVIPPSPNTAALGKYGDIPIGLFTGSPQISIPLCELKTKNISIPVALRYSSNGVRVDEYSSNVGMGWDLSVGGVVTRQVNDDPDENPQRIMPDFPGQLVTTAMEDFLISQTEGNGEPNSSDSQPDIFSFNFAGYSGRFYLDNNSTSITARTPILFEPAPLKINLVTSFGKLSQITITDPNGINYVFATTEKSMSRSSCVTLPGYLAEYRITNAWHLTDINYPNGDYVEFSYTSKQVNFDNGFSQSVTAQTDLNNSGCSTPTWTPCLYGSNNITPYLTEINAYTASHVNLGRITFDYSHKTDMPAGMDKLDKVALFDAHGALLKEQVLEYHSFGGSSTGNFPPPVGKTYHSKRFFLDRVTEKDSIGSTKPAHIFQYHQPHTLPFRFSYAQDYWGYYNGKLNTNLIDTRTLEPFMGNQVIANTLGNFNPANRDASSSYGKRGILTRITYPTGGRSDLYYEGHSYATLELEFPPATVQTARAENENDHYVAHEFTTMSIDTDQEVPVHLALSPFGGPIPEGPGDPTPDPDPRYFDMEIIDLTDNNAHIPMNRKIGEAHFPVNNPFRVTMDNFLDDYVVDFEKDHIYKVKVWVRRHQTTGSASVTYTEAPTQVMKNKSVGGLRIAKVETHDDEGQTQTRNYHYGTLENLEISSGDLASGNFTGTVSEFTTITDGESGANVCRTITFSSNSAFPIYGTYHIGYKSVIETSGDDFSGGGTVNTFQTQRLGFEPSEGWGSYIQGSPQSNFFGYGRPWETSTFKKEAANTITLRKQTRIYKHDPHFDKHIQAYNVRLNTKLHNSIGTNLETRIGYYDITGYKKKRQWHYLEKTIDSIFDQNGLNPMVTTTDYYYDNPAHLQVTRTRTTTSNDVPMLSKTYYPDDVTSLTALGHNNLTSSEKNAIDQLKAPGSSHPNGRHRLAEVIQTEVYKDFDNDSIEDPGELLNVQRTIFNSNSNPLPKAIRTLKGAYNSSTNTLNERITFHSYYSNDNIKEVSKTNGMHLVYIWGYNQQYPVAKIENATYADIPALIYNSILTASNEDDDTCMDSGTCKEQDLRVELDKLRDASLAPHLSNALITTYTYDPAIGLTSVTDPKGHTTYYEYDTFRRLKRVKNQDGHILSENAYYYKN